VLKLTQTCSAIE